MKKRIISLLLAVVLFATLPVMGAQALAAGETIDYKVGAQTMKMICEANGLDYDFCKAAITAASASDLGSLILSPVWIGASRL